MIALSARVASVLAVFVSASTVAGCSASSSPSVADAASAECASASVSFQKDVVPVFAANCSTSSICHGQMNQAGVENLYLGPSASGGANSPSDLASIHAGLVGVKSVEDPSMNIVTPGDLEHSFLWHKVDGDENSDSTVVSGCQPQANGPNPCSDCLPVAPCGVQMPLGGALEPSAICVLQNWITSGAMNN
jgi:hypothetical protein